MDEGLGWDSAVVRTDQQGVYNKEKILRDLNNIFWANKSFKDNLF